MPKLVKNKARGVLQNGFFATVDDYPIAGGWGLNGKLFAVGDASGSVQAFDGTSGRKIWKNSEAHVGGIMSMSVSSNGKQLASVGQDGQLALWDFADGQLQHRTEIGSGWVEHVAWSKSGNHLAVSSGRVVTILSSSGDKIWSSKNHPSTVSALEWVTDQELSTACYGRVTFFNTSSGKENERLEWQGSLVSLALSPDGNVVACGSQDKSVHFWRRSNGQDSMMSGYPWKPSELAFSHDSILLATGGGEDITVWSFEGNGPEGTTPGVLEFHKAPISSLAFSHHQRHLASGCREGGVVVWSLGRRGGGHALGGAPVNGSVENVYWRPDCRSLAAIDSEGGITVWRVKKI